MAKSKAKKTAKKKASGIIIVSGKKARRGSIRALNPQPLPPKQPKQKAKRKKKKSVR